MLTLYAQQTMVDTLPIAACVFTGPEHIITAANRQMLRIINRDQTVIGQQLLTGMPELSAHHFHELLTRVYESGEEYRDPDAVVSILNNGQLQPVYLDFSFAPLRDKDGTIYGVVTTAVDISERIAALEELKQTVEELAATNEELTALNEEYQTLNEEMYAANEELAALNEEYLSLNEELESGSEELRALNEELFDTKVQLEKSVAELADSEERLLLAAEAVNLGMYDQDLITQKVVTSRKLDSIFGVESGDHPTAYTHAIHPDDIEIRERAMARSLETGRLFYEVRLIKAGQRISWIRAEGKVLYDKENKPLRLLGTVLDFTEERENKEILRKLKALSDNSGDLMSLLDLDGKNSYINKAGKKLIGFESDEEVTSTPISELHTPEDFEMVQREVLPAVMSEGMWIGNMHVRHLKTGEIFPVLNYTVRIDDPLSGKTIGIGAIMRDLRPELMAKKALADSEQKLQNVTSAAPTALWMTDKKGNITYVNQTWIDWTGISYEENMGKGWINAIVAEDQQRVMATYLEAISQKQPFEAEFRIEGNPGKNRWYCASGKPQLDSEHHFNGFVGSCTDITSQKDLQQQKDDFIGIASHELKTPITSLKASVQLLNRLGIQPNNPVVPKLMEQAVRSVDRVSTLIEDLLNVTKLQHKELALKKTTFRIAELLATIASPIALSSGQHIEITGDVLAEVHADEQRIDQVVTNLLSNSIKYAPDSTLITVEVSKGENQVKVSVIDQGPGIPDDQIKNLFERFYRVDHMSQQVSGLGLGLYISAEIIQRHNGEIGVDSELGKGSTFWFTLPS
ncbi:PAS domain S-box protein [Pedobacter sp. PWIIR3]